MRHGKWPGKRILLEVMAAGGLGLLVAGCGSAEPPELQVRAVIDEAEKAVEARDASGVMDLVSPEYKDAEGRQPDELRQYLRGYFIANQSIHLLTRIESLEFPAEGVAEVALVVGMVGQEAEAQSAWNLAAEVRQIQLTLMQRGNDWLVTHATTRQEAR